MNISIIGTGYVGLVTGTCLADLGHKITCVDINKEKIKGLNQGKLGIYEPGLLQLFEINKKEGRLIFSDSIKESLATNTVVFIAVGTPQDEDGSADLKYVLQVAEDIGHYAKDEVIVVVKSTVPVGTCTLVEKKIKEVNPKLSFSVVSNPEFLREGSAVDDFMIPDRIIVGTSDEKVKKAMKEIYRGIERTGRPIVFTDRYSSEIIKYAANAMLATRISFVNMLSELCEKTGGNIKEVSRGIGLDKRIGLKFLHAGIGYGGSCFPKDVKALINTLNEHDCDGSILSEVDRVNKRQRYRFVEHITEHVDVKGKTIAAWGLAFKPKTDDMREAPSIDILKALQEKGAQIVAFDPVAQENAKELIDNVTFVDKPYDALEGADLLIICTEWDQFRNLDFDDLKKKMKETVIFDGRNIYDLDLMKEKGIMYYSIGRDDVL